MLKRIRAKGINTNLFFFFLKLDFQISSMVYNFENRGGWGMRQKQTDENNILKTICTTVEYTQLPYSQPMETKVYVLKSWTVFRYIFQHDPWEKFGWEWWRRGSCPPSQHEFSFMFVLFYKRRKTTTTNAAGVSFHSPREVS